MLALTELPYVREREKIKVGQVWPFPNPQFQLQSEKVYPTSRIALSVGPLVRNKISATLYIAAVYDVVMIMIIIIIHVSCEMFWIFYFFEIFLDLEVIFLAFSLSNALTNHYIVVGHTA